MPLHDVHVLQVKNRASETATMATSTGRMIIVTQDSTESKIAGISSVMQLHTLKKLAVKEICIVSNPLYTRNNRRSDYCLQLSSNQIAFSAGITPRRAAGRGP